MPRTRRSAPPPLATRMSCCLASPRTRSGLLFLANSIPPICNFQLFGILSSGEFVWGQQGENLTYNKLSIHWDYIYIYIPEGPGVLRWRSGGVGWGGACYRHVHVTLMLPWWEGWGGVGHVTVMFMLRWCYVDGGVGWGGACYRHVHVTLMLRWWEGWGGVGHVTVMFMLRWCYVDGRGGVGWGMLPSCSCYVDATLMGGVGWGGACYRHVHVTLMLRWWERWGGVLHVTVMFMLRWCYVDGRGGVGWGMLPSCSCYVDATLMGGVGWGGACYRHVHVTLMLRWWEEWGGVGHVTVMFMLRWCYVDGRVGWGGAVFTVYYIEWKHKSRLTVSTCNFLHIANSLQITVQK